MPISQISIYAMSTYYRHPHIKLVQSTSVVSIHIYVGIPKVLAFIRKLNTIECAILWQLSYTFQSELSIKLTLLCDYMVTGIPESPQLQLYWSDHVCHSVGVVLLEDKGNYLWRLLLEQYQLQLDNQVALQFDHYLL